jgi:toluene monooxygenase system ferredoxin subunit
MSFVRAMSMGELWNEDMVGVRVDGVAVLLVRHGGEVFAYEDRCAHQGVPLSQGRLRGATLTCSAHEWQYDVCTGRGTNPQGVCLTRLPVRIVDDSIWVDPAAGGES